ncbi:hypothetical protein MNBD_GAMMA11-2684 [hydrothermal vent metagenome]|uniref:Uncharacterized protein n=1 Tax=hydrothermal vent metagenome TaxID=652676 RepID=A0A3B0Y134_9ZZZZ
MQQEFFNNIRHLILNLLVLGTQPKTLPFLVRSAQLSICPQATGL